MIHRIACLFGGHRPNKNRIRHDGQDYVAPCRGCGETMFKSRTGERPWKLDDGIRAYAERAGSHARRGNR